MKKSIKILLLVLAIALVCAALVIGVFAKTAAKYDGVAGVTVVEAADFEDADKTIDIKGDDSSSTVDTPVGSMSATIIGRHGRLQVVSSQYEKNTYVTITPGYVQNATSGPFISNGYAAANYAGVFERSGMLNNRYQVMDFDIYFPTGRSIKYLTPAFQLRYLNTSGGNGSNTGNEKGAIGIVIYSDNTSSSGVYVQDNNTTDWSSNNPKIEISSTEWTHITYVIEMTDAWALSDGTVCSEGDEGAIAVLDFTGYIIVNDVIVSECHYGNTISFLGYTDASKFQSGDIRDMVFTEWRTGYNNNASDTYNKDACVALDNMSWRSINTGSYAKTSELQAALANGVGGSFADWSDSIYDADSMYFGTAVASAVVDGREVIFDNFNDAVNVAAEADATLKLLTDCGNFTANSRVVIDPNGFTMCKVGTGLAKLKVGNVWKVVSNKVLDSGYVDLNTFTSTSLDENGVYTKTSDFKFNTSPVTWNYIYKSGENSTISFPTENGNKYLLTTYKSAASKGQYIQINLKDKPQHQYVDFYSFDFDLFLPDGQMINNSYIMLQNKTNPSGTEKSTTAGDLSVYFGYSSGKVTLKNASGTGVITLDSDRWVHVTMIVDIEMTETGYVASLYATVDGGEFVFLKSITSTDSQIDYFKEARFTLVGSASAGGIRVGLDNMCFRTYKTGYEETGTVREIVAGTKPLSAWTENNYDPTATPYGNDVAELNGVRYDKLQDAADAALPGDVINILKNVKQPIYVSKKIQIATNGYTIGTVTVAKGLLAQLEDGVYNIVGNVVDFGVLDFESDAVGVINPDGESFDSEPSFTSDNSYKVILKGTVDGVVTERDGIIAIAEGTSGNKYVRFDWESTNSKAGDIYIVAGVAENPTENACPTPLSDRAVHTVDMDLFSPTGKFLDNNAFIFFGMKYYSTTSGSRAIFHDSANSVRGYYDTDKGLNYIQNLAGEKFYLPSNAWTHITAALVAEPVGNTYRTTIHVWLDGEYCGVFADDSSAPSGLSTETAGMVNMTELRVNFAVSTNATKTENASAAVDNLRVRAFGTGNETNLYDVIANSGSITEWEDTAYTADYVMPFGNAIIKTQDETEFDKVEDAVAHDKAADTKGMTVLKEFPESITLDYVTEVNTAGYAVTVNASGMVLLKDNGEGVYSTILLTIPKFEYTNNSNKVVVVYVEHNMTLKQVLSDTKSGTTIKFLSDHTILSDKNCTSSNTNDTAIIAKNITFDLNGFTFKMLATTSGAQPTILISGSNRNFTIKNGTIITGNTVASKEAYALTQAATGAIITLENCKFYGAAITYSYGAADCTINISNSEIYLNYQTKGGVGQGFINGRRLFDANITNTSFYIDDPGKTSNLVSLGAAALGTKQTGRIEFNNCDIVSVTGTKLVQYSSSLQEIVFTNCRISGNLGAPGRSSSYDTKGDGTQKITLGAGTALTSYNLDTTNVVDGYVVFKEASSKQIPLYLATGSHKDGNYYVPTLQDGPNSNETYEFVYIVVTTEYAAPKTVSWYDQNGNLIGTTEVERNTAAVPPAFTPVTKSANGWWRVLYDAWSTTEDGEATDNFIITDDCEYYLVEGAPKAYLTAAQFNLTLNGHIVMNFYLPNDRPDGIKITRVSGTQGKTNDSISLGGKKYTSYIAAYVGVTSMMTDTTVTVEFTAEIGGETVEFTQKIKLAPIRYAKSVLADYDAGATKYDPNAYTIVANMLRYAKNVYDISGYACTTISNLLNTYGDRLLTPIDVDDESDFPESNMVDLGDLKDYIQSVTFEISDYEPRYKVTFKPGTKVVGFHLEAIGYNRTTNGLDKGGVNWGYQTYTYSTTYGVYYYDDLGQFVNPRTGNVVDEYGEAIKDATAGTWSNKYIGSVHTQNIPIYNVDEDMTIVITLEDGTVVKGEYNIDTYYNNIKNAKDGEGNNKYTSAELTVVRTFFKSLRTYAKAVENYRFPEGKYPFVDLNKVNENGRYVVNATLFGAEPDDDVDDYTELKRAFEFANKMGYDVSFPAGEYTIGIDTVGMIPVKTNVDFGDATFDIQDNLYTESNTVGPNAGATITNTYKNDIFNVQSRYKAVAITENLPATIAAGATNIGYAPGYKALVTICNNNVKNYIRHGHNNISDTEKQTTMYEIVLVDENGNVDESTPILFDYTAITKLVVRRADEDPITIKGGTFITNTNRMYREYNYVGRGILVERSNVTLDNITHEIVGEDETDTGAPYHGFFYVKFCNNVLIKDCVIQSHKYFTRAEDNDNSMGTYDIGAEAVANLTYDGVVQSNFWYNGVVGGYVSNGTYGGVWGVAGSNDCKNMWYRNCTIARYDAHRGVVNGGVENSTITGVSILGGGTFEFRNNKVYSNTNQHFINLRDDFGSSWKGDMIFENVDWTCAKNASSTYLDLYVVSGTKNANHYFGYTCYAPNLIFNGTFKVTLTGKRNGGSSSDTAKLGTIYAGKFGTGNYSATCHGCDGSYSETASTYDTTTYGKVTNNTTTSISGWKN